jgi:hypothetical protein
VTAQDEFRVLMRDHLGPSLRARGWQGSGANWVRPHPTHWVLIGWQRSSWSDAAAVRFTGNLTVIAKDAWAAEDVPAGRVPARPPTSTYCGVGWHERLGGVVPDSGGDVWWSVRPGDDLAATAREVIGTLDAHGLPAIEQQLEHARASSDAES